MTTSNKWRRNIKIKHLYQTETTPENIIELCDSLGNQLYRIKQTEQKSNLTQDEKNHVSNRLEELIDHFSFLKSFATGDIPESEWADYGFDGDYEDWFNGYLTELYDLADERVMTTNGVSEKFIWIG
jgi:hypothetical protein